MRKVHAALCLLVAGLLFGCSSGTISNLQNVVAIPAVRSASGSVHGGQQPVSGATITLWAVGTTGYGSGATSLTTTTTAADGTFSITGTYTCPASNPEVYITAAGGNPGLGAGTNNSAILLMAGLTDCNTLKANAATTFININEVTTVAAAYSLAQFINPTTGGIGSYSYANTGLVNAFATAKNLASTSTGLALATTPNGNGVVPQSEINTLADILAPCVNSSSNGSSACTTLFGDLQGSPGNTLLAALSMALHPGYNVSTLFGLASGSPPFQPALAVAPNDWTVAMSFNGGAVNPRSLAIDGFGNVWTAYLVSGGTNSRLSKLSPLGVPQSGSPFPFNLNGANTVAIDTSNNVWVGNAGNGTLVGYSNSGTPFSGPFSGLSAPGAMAFDINGFLWIANNTNSSVAEFNPSYGSFISTGYTAGITTPFAIAADSLGNIWVGNGSTVTELNSLGVPSGVGPLTSGGINSPGTIAIDGSNNVWVSNALTVSSVAELNNGGTALSGSGYTGGGVGPSNNIAIDGGGNVWEAVRTANQLAELSSTGVGITSSTGYKGGSLNAPRSLAIDGSGNVWVANSNTTTTNGITTTISEFVGAAVPVITPLSAATQQGQLGKTPGTAIPVVIQSSAVPVYAPGSTYLAQLLATGGNSGTYTWSLASGSLPSPLVVTSTGGISGLTSLTGTYSFSVQACDSVNLSNCATKNLTLSADTTIPTQGNESALTGSYALQFEGYKNGPGTGLVTGSDFVASVTFNGTGGLTGEIDLNSKNASLTTSTTLTGYYSFGADHRGLMVIIPALTGKPIELAYSGNNFSGSAPQTLHFVEFDNTNPGTGGNTLATGAGIGKLQSSGAFVAATMNQSFVFGLQGETPCNNDSGVNPSCATVSPFGPLSAVGKFTGNGSLGISFGEEDAAGLNTSYNGITLSGSYTNPDSSGRGTLTLTPSGTIYPAAPSHFIYYVVNSGELYLMSSDGHLASTLLSGDALAQSGSFSNSTPTGNYIVYEESPDGGDGVASFPTLLDSSLVYLSVQSGQFAVTVDENKGNGGVQLEQNVGLIPFSVDSNGRLTLSSNQPVIYLANSTQGFGTEQPSATNQGNPGLLTMQQQTGGSFTCPSGAGTFAVASLQAPISINVSAGVSDLSTYNFTIDQSDPAGVLSLGLTGTLSCMTDGLSATTGRFSLTNNLGGQDVGYTIVPNSKYLLMSTSPYDGQPSVITVEK